VKGVVDGEVSHAAHSVNNDEPVVDRQSVAGVTHL